MNLNATLPILLGLAWLLPLGSFVLILFFGPRMGKAGRCAGYVAAGAILLSFVLSVTALVGWISAPDHALEAPDYHVAHGEFHPPPTAEPVNGDWYTLAEFGSLELTVGYYIDSLTIAMFCMVTLIASCIHIYSMGYMHEELEDVTDPLVTLADGSKLTRPGRYHRFFQYLSLFCFSMLGLVIAGNVLMVFMFWELVGICSYLLIGFYIERRSASTAANKAFIVNRVGDFGMIIGLMVFWTGLGTFSFGDVEDADGNVTQVGIFGQIENAKHAAHENHTLPVPRRMVTLPTAAEIEAIQLAAETPEEAKENVAAETEKRWKHGYWLLVIGGLGIFCGCMGKSAQFPLHVWLPDAMEGPTPVSALIHAATMVAAGVYLVGRFYPAFTPEVLLVIAYVGCITLFIAATIAITATDIKRVLAYSTVSQLGYMMLALGLGGWLAGLFHLFTHAFFKALLFLCSGSVIHACHTNEMPEMGGLRKKMPWTAGTMLVGCLAISGAGIPLLIGLSGYYSKDYIIAQALSFKALNPQHAWLYYAPVVGAAITACYMFRLWYMTFAGKPRDEHVYEHAHESPRTMVVPLVVLAVFAVVVGWNVPFTELGLEPLLEQARPAVTVHPAASELTNVAYPAEHVGHTDHAIHVNAGLIAFAMAATGFLLATVFYGLRKLDPEDARKQFAPLHRFLLNKWWFDELYAFLFIRPTLKVSGWVSAIDKRGIDWVTDNSARAVKAVSRIDDWIDRTFVDGLIDRVAAWTYALGLKLRTVQTGNLRQYVVWIAVGTVGLFVLVSLYWNYTL